MWISKPNLVDLSGRDRAILSAVAAGRVEMTGGLEPDFFIDDLCCCDQQTAHLLVHAGLITFTRAVALGSRVPAKLTDAGRAAIGLQNAA